MSDQGEAPTRVSVTVPASAANLGPGFDSFGLALARYDEVVLSRRAEGLTIDVTGVGADSVPRSGEHLLIRAAVAAFGALGTPVPGLKLACTNRIPHGGGQGSSAATIVAGVLAARALTPSGSDRMPDADVLDLAARLEGHPDNVAPALLGGFTIAWTDSGGRSHAVRNDVHPDVRAVVFTAGHASSTRHARAALPATVPHADAAANSARAALLVHALTSDPSLLFEATADLLHQQYRAFALPATIQLVSDLRSTGVAAVVSGAGPSVLVLGVGELSLEVFGNHDFVAEPVDIDVAGARVSVTG